jgi:hypothetical protein
MERRYEKLSIRPRAQPQRGEPRPARARRAADAVPARRASTSSPDLMMISPQDVEDA